MVQSARLRKLIGGLGILLWLFVYAGAAGWAGAQLTGMSQWIQLIYYVVAGFAWIAPLKPVFSWMTAPDAAHDIS